MSAPVITSSSVPLPTVPVPMAELMKKPVESSKPTRRKEDSDDEFFKGKMA